MIGFTTGELEQEQDHDVLYPVLPGSDCTSPPADFIFMERSLYLVPEAFEDEEVLFAAMDDLHDEDAIWLPGDFPEEGPIPEEVFVTIMANYGQVRKYLHRKALSRGYKKQNAPRGASPRRNPKAITDRKPTSQRTSTK